MVGGRDRHVANRNLIRCKDCRVLDQVEGRRRGVAAARAELDVHQSKDRDEQPAHPATQRTTTKGHNRDSD
jgi:hypothetical protein